MQQDLEGIYREHRQGLFTLALSITRCPDLAEDAVHDAFARLWRAKISPKGDSVAYVFATVRNAAVQQTRRRRRPVAVPVSMFGGQTADPAAAAIEAERQQLVCRAVETLPDRQREVVVLRIHAGLTFQQIAETLAEPLQTVASRYRRALGRIKKNLEKST